MRFKFQVIHIIHRKIHAYAQFLPTTKKGYLLFFYVYIHTPVGNFWISSGYNISSSQNKKEGIYLHPFQSVIPFHGYINYHLNGINILFHFQLFMTTSGKH